jgi:hypothetical protein
MPPGLILETLVAVLLALTIGICVRLERKLAALRSGQDGLKEIIAALNTATVRAQTSVAELRAAADAVGTDLGERVARARTLADELGIMLESGNSLAERLAQSGTSERTPRLQAVAAGRDGRKAEEWEQTLLKALREAR